MWARPFSARACSSASANLHLHSSKQFVPIDSKVRRNRTKNRAERSGLDCLVQRNCHMMLAVLLRRHVHVIALLSGVYIANATQTFNDLVAGKVTRHLHLPLTSSRTK